MKQKWKTSWHKIVTRYNPKIHFFKDGENFEKISKKRKCKKITFILKGDYFNPISINDNYTTVMAYKGTKAVFYDVKLGLNSNIKHCTIRNLTFNGGYGF